MNKVLMLCATGRDRREVTKRLPSIDVMPHFHHADADFFNQLKYSKTADKAAFDFDAFIETTVKELKSEKIAGCFSATAHPGATLSAIVARALGLVGPDPEVVARCQHKYYARVDQQRLIPEATPAFEVVPMDKIGKDPMPRVPPFFMKPVKGRFSAFARRIETAEDWYALADQQNLPPMGFLELFDQLMQRYDQDAISSKNVLIETILEGHHVTLDGFVRDGRVTILGIVDSQMYPGTISVARFQYPSALPTSVQAQMSNIASRYVQGIGLNNTMFNIEFMYDPEHQRIAVVELNPRIASGFADLYEKVDGSNLYDVAMALALGKQPRVVKGRGRHKVAASFVERIFKDQLVTKVPSDQDLSRVRAHFPDSRVEIDAKANGRLSEIMQDLSSFRVGLVHLGAQNEAELMVNHNRVKAMLPFEFEDDEQPSTHVTL
jgi:hypothetical protein